MDNLMLFTDGSVNAKSKIGYGSYLTITEYDFINNTELPKVKIKCFEGTSSTKLELETLLWALEEIGKPGCKITVYTDSQNVIRLPERRHRLEKNDYRSKKNRLLKNDQLYREFFRVTDQLDISFVKVRGHSVKGDKDSIDHLFTLVDRASRKALRKSV